MGRRGEIAALSWAAILIAGEAASAPASSLITPDLLAYVQHPENVSAVIAHAKPFIAKDPFCRAETARVIGLAVFRPVAFGPGGAPTSGLRKEGVQAQGCSGSGVYNVVTGVDNAGGLHTFEILQGSSIADPQLERDAIGYALMAARSKAPAGCAEAFVVDTAFEASGDTAVSGVQADREAKPWRETWTVQACAASIPVEMLFTPHVGGTTIAASLRAAGR
jgi:hypothetical protein